MNKSYILRKKAVEEKEEWLLPFADMMTLLLCFFVLIAVISSIDMQRYEAISDIMGVAMKSKVALKERTSLEEVLQEIKSIIGVETSGVQLEMRPGVIAVNLTGAVLFNRGSADLTEATLSILNSIVGPLLDIPYQVSVEGHTDNIPIKSEKFPSNWELSSARASAVGRFLIDRGFPKDKIKVLGMADTMPLLPNENKNGQPIPKNLAKNRRVVILISP